MIKKSSGTNIWDPIQYRVFEKERNEPFYDLLKMIKRQKFKRIVDLGCGSGALTHVLHTSLNSPYTLGIDNSSEMFKVARSINEPNLEFGLMDVDDFLSSKNQEPFDLIFSNACLQWLPNHQKLFAKIKSRLSLKGQIAIQVPSNFDYPTHVIAKKLSQESPFNEFFEKKLNRRVLKPEHYAELLYDLGFKNQCVRMQVYGHALKSTESVFEWVKGSLLTYYQGKLPSALYKEFFQIYRERVLAILGERKPFFLPFKRILIHATLDSEP